jgi:glycosyltransferase involved in cell wall biosynthesis
MQNIPLSVVMPVFNERETVQAVVRRIFAEIPLELELIAVDDGSTDGSGQILDELASEDARIKVLHQRNQGKSAALKRGFEYSRGEVVIIQDADLEYDPAEIFSIVQPILQNRADVVYGSRFLVRRASRVLYFYHYIANRLLTFLSNTLTNLNMTDVETGYKAFRGEIIRNMVITASGFGIEIEMTAKVAKLPAVIFEVPISYYGRTYEEGKKIGTKDGLLALWYILQFNLFSSRNSSFRKIPKLYGSQTRSFAETSADPSATSFQSRGVPG